jgi:plasmid stability protein
MQYTLRNVPKAVDQALREQARREGKSLNEVAIEALLRACGLTEQPVKHRDLSWMKGTWVDDPERDAVREIHERIEHEDCR